MHMQRTIPGLSLKAVTVLQHLLQLSMLDSPKMQWVKLSVVDRIQPKLTGFDMGVENKA